MKGKLLLTIVTRCCRRPRMLAKNISSVLVQTERNVEQVFLVDRKGRGVRWANRNLALNKDRVIGRYVYILDDDTRLVDRKFVVALRKAVKDKPGVVMVKSRRPQLRPCLLPKSEAWGRRDALKVTSANCLCYIVRRDLWVKHIGAFGVSAGGDWHFLKALLKSGCSFVWLDRVVAETQQLGRGTAFEKCSPNWFKAIAAKFRLEEVTSGDWRLKLYRWKSVPRKFLRMAKAVKNDAKVNPVPQLSSVISTSTKPFLEQGPAANPSLLKIPAQWHALLDFKGKGDSSD